MLVNEFGCIAPFDVYLDLFPVFQSADHDKTPLLDTTNASDVYQDTTVFEGMSGGRICQAIQQVRTASRRSRTITREPAATDKVEGLPFAWLTLQSSSTFFMVKTESDFKGKVRMASWPQPMACMRRTNE